MMKRSEDYEVRFTRLSARIEKILTSLLIGFILFFIIGQCAIHLLPNRFTLSDTIRWEGSVHILQK